MKIEPTKEFACKLGIMLESKLIWYKHFHPSMELEHKQSEEIRDTFRNEITVMQEIYDVFRVYFKQYIRKEREA